MPTIMPCPACSGPLATTAAACPRCGHRKRSRWLPIALVAFLVLFLLAVGIANSRRIDTRTQEATVLFRERLEAGSTIAVFSRYAWPAAFVTVSPAWDSLQPFQKRTVADGIGLAWLRASEQVGADTSFCTVSLEDGTGQQVAKWTSRDGTALLR